MDKNIERSLMNMPLNMLLRKRNADLKVGVIAGGISSEREVSLSTGRSIYEALIKAGYNTQFIDFEGNVQSIIEKNINVAFIALHGKYGEDGTIQGLLELLKVPYTGSGVLSSALAMDKIFTKKIFQFENIPTPDFLSIHEQNFKEHKEINSYIKDKIRYPVIVKPNRGGSTIGVNIVNKENDLQDAIKAAFVYDNAVLVEKYIKGRLLTVGIIGNDPIALPLIEIKPKSGFYDYAAKYTQGLTEYLVPAPVEKSLADNISNLAIRCHEMLDCSGVSRVDLIMDMDNNINILEVNTIPGMTPTSLVPKAAASCGIDFVSLAEIILNCASLKL